jgi:radical SAM protein with 4Fe4S-binding SPASM domain
MSKEYLKENLKVVEVEIFSYCNRTCWFCPNSFIDRKSTNIFMEEDVYLSILNQLKEIDYSGDITYSRYNEPTSNKDIFLKRIRQARELLPKANLKTNSNGDYIDHDYVLELREAGLNELFLQHYDLKPLSFDYEKNKELMEKRLQKLNFPYSILKDIPKFKIEYKLEVEGIRVQLRSRNFNVDGSSRGNTISLATDYTRTQRCMQVFNNMYIDYNGNVMICCALRSDIPEHNIGIMGNVKESTISSIFSSYRYTSWREHHNVDGPKEGVCKTCRDNVKPSYEN